MLVQLNIYTVLITFTLRALIYPELVRLRSMSELFSKVTSMYISPVSSYFFICSMILVLPIISIVSILSIIKVSYSFSRKCIVKSYYMIIFLFLSSLNIKQCKDVYFWLIKMSSSKYYYFVMYHSKIFEYGYIYSPILEHFLGYIIHNITFVLIIACYELAFILTYQTINNRSIYKFLLKGKYLILVVFTVLMFYISLIVFLEELFKDKLGEREEMSFFYSETIYESTIMNAGILYIYHISALEGF